MKITVRVPPSCSLDSSPVILDQDSQFVSSTFFESCNTNRGFQIVATHRPLAATERANVSFDGIQSSLNAGGLSFVQFRQGARHGPIAVNVAAESLDAPLAVSFAMTPV
ncbi:MAG: hypothetical protein V2I43_11780 [Parvularcula sp.]|nr:hypothetical protein [Parvularcula sp.]